MKISQHVQFRSTCSHMWLAIDLRLIVCMTTNIDFVQFLRYLKRHIVQELDLKFATLCTESTKHYRTD